MRLENDIVFTGQWCFTVAEGMKEDIVEINGSEGKISFPVFGHEVRIQKGDSHEVLSFDPPQHIQQPMIEKIVQYFLGKAENPCSAADAIESMKVMDSFTYRK
jgi:predicted dehydrogenase